MRFRPLADSSESAGWAGISRRHTNEAIEMKPEELDAVYRRAIRKAGPVPESIPRQDAELAYLYFAYLFRELVDVKATLADEVESLRDENSELRKENLDLHRELKRITERRKKK